MNGDGANVWCMQLYVQCRRLNFVGATVSMVQVFEQLSLHAVWHKDDEVALKSKSNLIKLPAMHPG